LNNTLYYKIEAISIPWTNGHTERNVEQIKKAHLIEIRFNKQSGTAPLYFLFP